MSLQRVQFKSASPSLSLFLYVRDADYVPPCAELRNPRSLFVTSRLFPSPHLWVGLESLVEVNFVRAGDAVALALLYTGG
jgi:hypothetical protein